MRKLFPVAIILVAFVSTAASAADLPTKAPPYIAPVAVPPNWAFAGGNEVRCRNLRGVRSAVRGIAQWRQNSAEKSKGPAID